MPAWWMLGSDDVDASLVWCREAMAGRTATEAASVLARRRGAAPDATGSAVGRPIRGSDGDGPAAAAATATSSSAPHPPLASDTDFDGPRDEP